MAKKSILKSVRLSQEVYDYIDNFAGEGFNQKFENIILYARRSEKNRHLRIKQLDADIKKKEQEYLDLRDVIKSLRYRVSSLERNFDMIESGMNDILGTVKKK